MKYLLRHLDESRQLLMDEIVQSNWSADLVLKSEGQADVDRRKRAMERLIREGIEGIRPADNHFRVAGGEAVVYTMVGDDEDVLAIHTCSKLPLPLSLILRPTRTI